METRANYVTVGLFTLIVLAAAFAFIYWVARLDESSGLVPLNVRIAGSVTGLGEGSEVLFNGIKVGKVDRVAFDPQDPRVVYAITSVKSDTPVRADTSASIGSQGLTGISYISLSGGTPSAALLLEGEGEGVPVIEAAPSAVGDILETVRAIAGRADRMMTSLDDFMKEVRNPATNSVKNIETFSSALAKNSDEVESFMQSAGKTAEAVNGLSSRLDGTLNRVDEILAAVDPEKVRNSVENVETFTRQLKDSTARIDGVLAKLDGFLGTADGKGLSEELTATLADFRETSQLLRTRVNEISAGLARFSDQGLDDVRTLVQETRRSINRIEQTVSDFEDNPQRIITGGERARTFDGRPRR
jgi:phospholipid/cholesterol/gamma-HCH transport system substrate-binding protein